MSFADPSSLNAALDPLSAWAEECRGLWGFWRLKRRGGVTRRPRLDQRLIGAPVTVVIDAITQLLGRLRGQRVAHRVRAERITNQHTYGEASASAELARLADPREALIGSPITVIIEAVATLLDGLSRGLTTHRYPIRCTDTHPSSYALSYAYSAGFAYLKGLIDQTIAVIVHVIATLNGLLTLRPSTRLTDALWSRATRELFGAPRSAQARRELTIDLSSLIARRESGFARR